LDLGIEPYLVASSLLACVAQRLIRIVCPHCSVATKLDRESLRRLQIGPADGHGQPRDDPDYRDPILAQGWATQAAAHGSSSERAPGVMRRWMPDSLLGAAVRTACGCERCGQTGYRGRKGVFEMLVVDERIRELMVAKSKTSEIERAGIAGGMATLRQDAIRKMLEGATTVEEVVRVTHQDGEIPLPSVDSVAAHETGV
jgi:general secretion pathway protein E